MNLLYRNRQLYRLAMRALYRNFAGARLEAVADLIAPGSHVLDLCCGPGDIYRTYLAKKGCTYLGLDRSEAFIASVRSAGGQAELVNLPTGTALPSANFVIMIDSLYQFLPHPEVIVRQMLLAADRAVIISEPIQNLSNSRWKLLRRVADWLSGGNGKGSHVRFDERSLNQLMSSFHPLLQLEKEVAGGRDKLYLLRAETT